MDPKNGSFSFAPYRFYFTWWVSGFWCMGSFFLGLYNIRGPGNKQTNKRNPPPFFNFNSLFLKLLLFRLFRTEYNQFHIHIPVPVPTNYYGGYHNPATVRACVRACANMYVYVCMCMCMCTCR